MTLPSAAAAAEGPQSPSHLSPWLSHGTVAREASAIIGHHSKSFSLASRLLPAEVAYEAQVLYAYCRHVDDAVDEVPASAQAGQLLALRNELDGLYRGDAMPTPLLTALQRIVVIRRIPRLYFDELIAGMQMDAEGHVYRQQADLLRYCYRVASTVGLMMCHIMGVTSDRALRHAAHLGIAMQLTNIARDVQEDWGRGRLYLPDDLLAAHGVGDLRQQLPASASPLAVPDGAAPGVASAVGALLDTAEAYYRSGDAGLGYLSPRCAFAVSVARRVYSDIGRSLRRKGCDPRAGRAYVTMPRKLWLVANGLVGSPSRALFGHRTGPLQPPGAVIDAATSIAAPVSQLAAVIACVALAFGCGASGEPMSAADFEDATAGEESALVVAAAPESPTEAPGAVQGQAEPEAREPAAHPEAAAASLEATAESVEATAEPKRPGAEVTAPSGRPGGPKRPPKKVSRSRPHATPSRPSSQAPVSAPPAAASAGPAPRDKNAEATPAPAPAPTTAQPPAEAPKPKVNGEVVVDVIGFENTKGQVLVALWRQGKGFPEQGRRADGKKRIWPKSQRARIVFSDVPPGRFSVAVHHDEDKDFEMDTGLFGIPSEGYGFSRDALGSFGPPSFEDASYVLGRGERKQIRIKMRY